MTKSEDYDIEDNSEIQEMVDINVLENDYDPVISEIRWCREKIPRKPPKVRDKWHQSYALPEDTYINRPKITSKERDSPHTYKSGDSISAIEAIGAMDGNFHGFDVRPKVFDNITKKFVLLDSGSCVSCYPAGPNDVMDPSLKLRSVNGGTIDTFGTKKMTLRIGRKTYSIDAIIAAVPAQIFGWDIFRKYRLNSGLERRR